MLHLNKKFIEDYRNKEAHIVSGHTFDLMFKKKHQGNQETYLAILDMLEHILSCFNYISLSCWVRLPFLESLSDEGLQIYEFDNNIPFEKWRLNVLSKYADLCWMKDEYQDYLDFNFDYKDIIYFRLLSMLSVFFLFLL